MRGKTMRSPEATFDLRAALAQEVRAAISEFDRCAHDDAALHRCRVRLKRARALARIGAVCAPGLAAVFNDSARAAMHLLAETRDLISLEEAARAAARKTKRRKDAAALAAIADNIREFRDRQPDFDDAAMRAALRDLLALAQVWPEASDRQVRRGAKRLVLRAERAFRHALDASARHLWRRREKDRLHAALLLDDAWPGRRRGRTARKLGDVLGAERDAALLLDRITEDFSLAGDAGAAVRALRVLKGRRRRLAERADALGAKLHPGLA